MRQLSVLAHEYTAMGVLGPIQLIGRRRVEYPLFQDTVSYSLLFYKVYIRRENAGSWNSGLEKEQVLETYFAQLQKS